ncbi:Engulfment and cell motility protein 3 [Homalodisca vitripennis]|nr:Engulfment and cell motility protein 3 [Homalodisca vitripennis]
MAHQLYVLQTLSLGLLEQRMNIKMDPQDQDAHDKIKELRRIAFDSDGTGSTDGVARRQHGGYAKDYKKLGFKCDINPAMDFTETPPGMLALDCMIYFARNHTESYTKPRDTFKPISGKRRLRRMIHAAAKWQAPSQLSLHI